MNDSCATTATPCRWLHYWAVLTVCATLPLLLLGAEVTTKQVGMVDQDWPTYPWHLLVNDWQPSGLGYLIEHSHRVFGYLVGVCVIGLNLGLWWTGAQRWLRGLGLAALIGVCVQGLLGGLRVKLNALAGPELAMVHGVFAQGVFALLVSLAVCTSRRWTQIPETVEQIPGIARLRRGALILLGLLFVQIVLGSWLRHLGTSLSQRGHVLMAFIVVAAATWLVGAAFASRDRSLRTAAGVLAGLMALQLSLGLEAWLIKLSPLSLRLTQPPAVLMRQDLTRSAHYLIGSLVLAAALVLTLRVYRTAQLAASASERSGKTRPLALAASSWEGA